MLRTSSLPSIAVGACLSVAACNGDRTVTPPPTTPSLTIGNPINTGSKNRYTLAVIGDIPYGAQKLIDFPRLIDLMNRDPKVDLAHFEADDLDIEIEADQRQLLELLGK